MDAIKPLVELAPRDDQFGELRRSRRLAIAPHVDHRITRRAQGGQVRKHEPVLEIDSARAQVTHAPAVLPAGPPGMTRKPVKPLPIEHRRHREVERRTHDHRRPAGPPGAVHRAREPLTRAGQRGHER